MSPLPGRGRDVWRRLWKTTRHDIGRKLTALVMAVALWSALQNLVIGMRPLDLAVRSVPTQAAADEQRRTTPGVYLVVPDELIVISVSEPRAHLTVTGLRDDVVGLNMSAVLPFFVTDLAGADEVTLRRPLDRDVCSVPQGQPNPRLTSFRMRPDVLEVTLARRETAEITLSDANVVTAGKPKEGYFFRQSRIGLTPSTVNLTGPSKVIEPLVQDPSRVKLEPIDIAGKSSTVSQRLGLSQELLDQGVTLQEGRDGTVLVNVPIEAEDIERDLFQVPIQYLNADTLDQRKQRVSSCPKTLDIRIKGPPVVLSDLSPEELLGRIVLVFDWKLAPEWKLGPESSEQQATGTVVAALVRLPETVKVTDQKGAEVLKIEYTLQSTDAPGAADGK